MEPMEGAENGNGASCPRVIAVALNGGSKSKHIVHWAFEKFGAQGQVSFKLIHVFSKITGVPTPMGNLIPLSQVRDDVVAAYKKEIEWQKNQTILPYQRMLTQKKVLSEVVMLESDDIWNAITKEIAKGAIKDLVIGASSNSLFARKFKGQSLSSLITEYTPSFCAVYVVSKGKLETLRASQTEQTKRASIEYDSSAPDSTFTSSRFSTSSLESGSTCSESSYASLPGLPRQPDGFNVKNGSNYQSLISPECTSFKSASPKDVNDSLSVGESRLTLQASPSRSHSVSSIEEQQKDVISDLEKLRIELRHIHQMYSLAQNKAENDATRKVSDVNRLRHEGGMTLKEIKGKEEIAKVLARLEKERSEATKKEAEYARECALIEELQRREAEQKGARDVQHKQKLIKELIGSKYQFQTFTWEEIESATNFFNKKLKIRDGSYGTVYKCRLHHTSVAIKVLHSKHRAQTKRLLHELENLSKISHPHLLSFIGACPEQGCLVYEYMKNGSLEDHLFRKNDTTSIPWYERFRIVWEVASTLSFLHNSKPNPIIHRALKLSNILLDHNYVIKISDTGLCTMLSSDAQITSDSNSVKDDIYALGVVILQLLTGKPDMGVDKFVENAIKECHLMNVLDKHAGRWPFRETSEMALLGLKCVGVKSRNENYLNDVVLPVLEGIKEVAEKARDFAEGVLVAPPSHFICPILMDVMEDPYIASDGYTYDRKAIELWVKDNDTSPTTNFPLANKHLIPNHSLYFAIMEWRSKRNQRAETSKIYSKFECSNTIL